MGKEPLGHSIVVTITPLASLFKQEASIEEFVFTSNANSFSHKIPALATFEANIQRNTVDILLWL
jgi:actin-related protein